LKIYQTHGDAAAARLGKALRACPLVAILRWITPPEVEDVAAAVVEEGFGILEVPLNSPDALVSIERLARRFGEQAVIGAGTVISPAAVLQVRDSGGTMIVMPHADVGVIRAARDQGMSCIPGVATPTEGFAALNAGATALKVFPAEAISPSVLKAWRAVFSKDIPLLPTGGVTEESMAAWRAAGATGFGIGGNLYRPGRSASEVREAARSFVSAWSATSPAFGTLRSL